MSTTIQLAFAPWPAGVVYVGLVAARIFRHWSGRARFTVEGLALDTISGFVMGLVWGQVVR